MEIPDDIWRGLGLQINEGKITASPEVKECMRQVFDYAYDISEVPSTQTGFAIVDGATAETGLPIFDVNFGFYEEDERIRENAVMWVEGGGMLSDNPDIAEYWESGEAFEDILRAIRGSECFAIQEEQRKKLEEIQKSVSEIAVKKNLPLGVAAKHITPLLTRHAGRKKKSRRQKKVRGTRRR